MSAFGDAMTAIKEVVLLKSRVEILDQRIGSVSDDLDGLADMVASVRDRVSRLEGVIEGAAIAAGNRPQLPRK